jgi:hypothetical protein
MDLRELIHRNIVGSTLICSSDNKFQLIPVKIKPVTELYMKDIKRRM